MFERVLVIGKLWMRAPPGLAAIILWTGGLELLFLVTDSTGTSTKFLLHSLVRDVSVLTTLAVPLLLMELR